MGATLLRGDAWGRMSKLEREQAFADELEKTLDALDYCVKRGWVAD